MFFQKDINNNDTGLSGDTLILTKQGKIRLDECHNKKVLTFIDTSYKVNPDYIEATLINKDKKEIYEVSFSLYACPSINPVKIKITNEHKLFTYNCGGGNIVPKKIKNINETDKIIYFNDTNLDLFDKEQFIKHYHFINKKYHFTQIYKLNTIKYIGTEIVYDLNIPNKHNFIANGVIVHNA